MAKKSTEARVCENIAAIRVKLGLTQDEVIALATKKGIKISRRTYGEWERGEGSPTVKSLAKLEKVFGVDIKALVA